MAKNLKTNVDAAALRDSMRPNMPPGLHSHEEASTDNVAKGTDVDTSATIETHPVSEPIAQETKRKAKGATRPKVVSGMPQGTVDEFMEYFVKRTELPLRSPKTAYVRPAYHARIMRILSTIHKGELSLSGYIDHVLTHHFLYFEDAIRTVYGRELELSGDIYAN